MTERTQEPAASDGLDDIFEPALMDMADDDFDEVVSVSTEKQRLEQRRLREELGYYDLELEDF